VILGSGSQQPELESLVDGLGLSGTVEFRGFDPNPYAWMAKASLFVMASRYEGFGVVLLRRWRAAHRRATDCPSGPGEILPEAGMEY
jgi:glycosyltransferase involved in cell wall biosynthesis